MPECNQTGNRYFALVLVASIFLYLWPVEYFTGPRHSIGDLVILFNVALCLEYHRRYSRTWKDWGFSRGDLRAGLAAALIITFPLMLAIAGLGFVLGSWKGLEEPGPKLAGLFLWALAQQFALQTVLLRELSSHFGPSTGVKAAAVVFSFLHLPNPFLMPLTLAGGWTWCWIYSRHPHLLPLALSHSLCSLTMLSSFSREITGGMRVGYAYFLLGA